ncbi:thiazole synthase [Ethanoligenens harbinense]|uniref:Thiazole synthase n=1 Tax=Ethanoligenens harbinense (strain DSM 18485 / JCM 12961 / CGMCC 1.5033 / YUAN-3) TaxID=663278 RepID=E6U7L0_ETHHY|nr:thiazole synthase [Ethanoligenens harbinense]ADU27033.1 thiazole biosynthesis family protein [Ethanoligenens harbinense YUAN-3]AVQ96119.1 thiazole synthase [Ethanoligenens harbinense YUAN-3]AYF38780.1 thiazole synthase [Ethanoligenens harbinense]AYF42904.1 thiazole synthase [Ethanoligenens harbinense]QCN92360.1 thiazole synthase [Ethanoligenens harbinense]
MQNDPFVIGGKVLNSRLFVGTGKYPDNRMIRQVVDASGAEVVTVALRRVNLSSAEENLLRFVPEHCTLLPNTSGARTAEEAVRIARLARAAGCGDWIKIEVIADQKYLLPDNEETLKATRMLVDEGFQVFPYICPELMCAKRLQEAGATAVMPLGAPIGSNRGLQTRALIQILIDELDVPVIVDAGIGAPSHATEAMEMGAGAVLLNTGISSAADPVGMAEAFGLAVRAGRLAHRSGLGATSSVANASSPLTGFLDETARA